MFSTILCIVVVFLRVVNANCKERTGLPVPLFGAYLMRLDRSYAASSIVMMCAAMKPGYMVMTLRDPGSPKRVLTICLPLFMS